MRLFLCGDVMTGRGIDQTLPHPCDPKLYESCCKSARDYVQLAERLVGSKIPTPVPYEYIWGESLAEMESRSPDLRIINLETSITSDGQPDPEKGIHYRMNPRNVECLRAGKVDCAVLANNHVADWSVAGLRETLEVLGRAGVTTVGAGMNRGEAEKPAVLRSQTGSRIVIHAFASPTAGIPSQWAATDRRPGVNYLPDYDESTGSRVIELIDKHREKGDFTIVSIHWGPNWGYDIPDEHQHFAHRLVDEAAVDVVYGHSSHHAVGLELYKGAPIIYGCGDFINDYEGIAGYEEFRSDLALAYFLDFDKPTRQCTNVEMVPFRSRKFRLEHVSQTDAEWIRTALDRECRRLRHGRGVELTCDGALRLEMGRLERHVQEGKAHDGTELGSMAE